MNERIDFMNDFLLLELKTAALRLLCDAGAGVLHDGARPAPALCVSERVCRRRAVALSLDRGQWFTNFGPFRIILPIC